MNELGLSQVALAARCAGAAHDLFAEDVAPQITRERIAKILMHSKGIPGRSAAQVIGNSELQVLASALKVSPEWLGGRDDSRELVLWDPLADPVRADHILHLMNEHEDEANEVLIWSEYLICALETPEFMHKHHEALFKALDILGAHDEKRKVVQIYDQMGSARRKRLLESNRRSRRLVQFIFESDFERIVRGEGEYAEIRKGLRMTCLENVIKLLSDSSLGIELAIVSNKDATALKAAFRDYDSVGVFDEDFAFWRYHSGRIAWSEHPDHTRSYRKILKTVEIRAGTRSAADVLMLAHRLGG